MSSEDYVHLDTKPGYVKKKNTISIWISQYEIT